MDHLSAWIDNKQLMNQISNQSLLGLQNDIIQYVFGGFDEMLNQYFIKYPVLRHKKLNQISSNKLDVEMYHNDEQNKENENKEEKKLHIFDIPNDC